MSDITSADSGHAMYAGLVVDIAEDSLDKATRLLAGINGGVYKDTDFGPLTHVEVVEIEKINGKENTDGE